MEIGSIVRSSAGRDKDKFFAVVAFENGRIYIADGKEHKLERPKLKNKKHLLFTKDKICPQDLQFNRTLRKRLLKYNGNKINGEVTACQKKM